MSYWFGDPWPSDTLRASVCENDTDKVATPVGQLCVPCQEPITMGDRGSLYADGEPAHVECSLRSVLGNHLHLGGLCRHIGDCVEQSTISYREEALLVWEMTQKGWSYPVGERP